MEQKVEECSVKCDSWDEIKSIFEKLAETIYKKNIKWKMRKQEIKENMLKQDWKFSTNIYLFS